MPEQNGQYVPSESELKRMARANERRRKDARNVKIYELWKGGMNARQISEYFTSIGEPINRQRVNFLIKRGMAEAREAREEITVEIFDGELERLTAIYRQAWQVVTATCRICRGRGSREGVAGVGATELPCMACEGSGHAHKQDTRIKAMKEARNAIDQRAKMLGLYAPERFALTDRDGHDLSATLRAELENMPTDELDKALTDYMAGVEAARTLDAAVAKE